MKSFSGKRGPGMLVTAALLLIVAAACGREVTRLSNEQVADLMDKPGVTIIDVRLEGNWSKADEKIKGARREDPETIDSWTNKYDKDQTLVFYCD